jgi:hypothetical protein
VDRTRREDGRHGQAVGGQPVVTQDDDLDAAFGRRHGRCGERRDGRGKALGTRGRRPGRVERPDAPAPAAEGSQQPIQVRDHRPRQAQGPRSARRAAQEGRPATELHPQVHHDALPLGVDGRVGDLGECLAEMVRDRTVQPAATGRRGVVAHAPQRLVALEGHRPDVEAGALGIDAGEVAQGVVERLARLDRRRSGLGSVFVERPGGVVDGQRAQDPALRVGVLEDDPTAGLHEQHLARSEPTTAHRLGRRERDGTGLRRDGHEPVARHGEGRRPEPVAIDQCADAAAVGEDDRGRPVPGRQHPGRPAPKRRNVRMRRPAQGEGLRDRREERDRQVPAGRREQLEALVERQRVGTVGR